MGAKNKLYFGDNLRILREYVPDASVDLIYLDPPFNSSPTNHGVFVAPRFIGARAGLPRSSGQVPPGATGTGEESAVRLGSRFGFRSPP
jgi:hypothetical protein